MEPTRREQGRFRELLARLKRRGCTLLVVGETDAKTRRVASRRLFGDPDADRERLLVTPCDVEQHKWLPDSGTVIRADVPTRSAAAQPRTEESVQSRVRTELDRTTAEPGRFRLGVTSLAPLLERENGDAVVEALREGVLDVQGMGHFHLCAPIDAPQTRRIADEFDVVVELRSTPSGPQQRWHLQSATEHTPWIPIDD